MSVVVIFSGSFCNAEKIAEKVASSLGHKYVSENLLEEASRRYSVPKDKLFRAMHGPTPFLNKLTHEKEKHLAYIKATLAEIIQQNNIVYHGFASLLLPKSITHILRVCIAADHNFRVDIAVKSNGISIKDANNLVRKDDNQRYQWSQYLFGLSPWEKELYDITIPMNASSVEDAVKIITDNTLKEAVRTTPESQKAITDFVLSARVNVALMEKNHEVDVSCDDGKVTIVINKFVKRLEHKKEQLQKIAGTVDGVKSIETRIGPKFNFPSIYPPEDFKLPSKILLVDDEIEFVHALSERLQTRNLESMVVYDGEDALAVIENDQPEVMVLDLKMPGIDGLEVLRQVKKSHPETEVIILTGHGSEKEEELAIELGAFAYLQKPVDIDKLSETMKNAYKKIREK